MKTKLILIIAEFLATCAGLSAATITNVKSKTADPPQQVTRAATGNYLEILRELEATDVANEPDEPDLSNFDERDAIAAALDRSYLGRITEQELPGDAQPSPYPAIAQAINLLKITADDKFIDIGCGADARVCVEVGKYTQADCLGIEYDHDRTAMSKQAVEYAGLSDRITIVQGDARDVDWEGANVGYVYLFPDVLEELRDKLTQLDRFVSYSHPVPGLQMTRYGDLYYWERPTQAATVTTTGRAYAVYNGHKYYGRSCNNPNCGMCAAIESQIASRKHVDVVATPKKEVVREKTVTTSQPVQSSRPVVQQQSYYCKHCRKSKRR